MMKTTSATFTIAFLLLATACGAPADGASDPADSATTTTESPDVTPTPGDPGGPDAPPAYEPGDDPVAFAIADLAFRLGVAGDEVMLVEQTEVTWRDGSLGCPLPGMFYTQALVDGSRIVLEVEGVEYSYHQGGDRAPFWCENPAE